MVLNLSVKVNNDSNVLIGKIGILIDLGFQHWKHDGKYEHLVEAEEMGRVPGRVLLIHAAANPSNGS